MESESIWLEFLDIVSENYMVFSIGTGIIASGILLIVVITKKKRKKDLEDKFSMKSEARQETRDLINILSATHNWNSDISNSRRSEIRDSLSPITPTGRKTNMFELSIDEPIYSLGIYPPTPKVSKKEKSLNEFRNTTHNEIIFPHQKFENSNNHCNLESEIQEPTPVSITEPNASEYTKSQNQLKLDRQRKSYLKYNPDTTIRDYISFAYSEKTLSNVENPMLLIRANIRV
ncbi:hypothetical protein BB560_001403 [Smittium megazygosporum]|uniref:Uncharacterized protein n=1 Tax=Smittium megazygosporum TaxID=133381 RepID=A0A2T9ZHP4_9FUNG|nr:hypothetical protein BB560_001401 [Smittium megazygosporum]PVV04112.1 hypothetical protein BB560_001403 [Smittium megazygosporum]